MDPPPAVIDWPEELMPSVKSKLGRLPCPLDLNGPLRRRRSPWRPLTPRTLALTCALTRPLLTALLDPNVLDSSVSTLSSLLPQAARPKRQKIRRRATRRIGSDRSTGPPRRPPVLDSPPCRPGRS